MRLVMLSIACALALPALAQNAALPQVTISAQANRDPVEKSYRQMLRGVELFEQRRAALAPDSTLRFKLLPRRPTTDMSNVEIDVIGKTDSFSVPVSPDHTFTLERNGKMLAENAQVTPNRKSGSMTWRTEIRSAGVPAGMRRLGDLRLECEVGMEAGVVSNSRTIVGQIANLLTDTSAYCRSKDQLYLFFAERPIFAVTLAAGNRREVLGVDRLYASASDDSWLKNDLPYCDCEVMLDRTYFLPLADPRWPDDTQVEFEYMEGGP